MPTPTPAQLAAALRDVLPYAYAHAQALLATAEILGLDKTDAERAVQRCEAAGDVLAAIAEPVRDIPPVLAKVPRTMLGAAMDGFERARDLLRGRS